MPQTPRRISAEILYVDFDKTTRDGRVRAMDGEQLPSGLYKVVRVFEGDEHDAASPEAACDELFAKLQAVDAPVLGLGGERIRSMMVGDMIVLDGERYLCARDGWKRVDLLVGDTQWYWDSRTPPTEVEVKVAKVLGPNSYEVLLYNGMEACQVTGRSFHHKPVTSNRVPWQERQ
jgi:hypothetical protein